MLEISNFKEIEKFLLDSKFRSIFVIGGNNSFSKCGFNSVLKNKNYKFKISYFFKKKSLPEYEELIKIIDLINSVSPDLILAVGGGSVLDYSKIANSIIKSENLKSEIKNGTYKLKKKNRKIVNIPTTAGSGAEVTSTAVIYVDNKKYSIEGLEIRPDYFFLIPELIKSNNFTTTSSSALDCIAQALESLFAMKSTDESAKFALKSLELSLPNFKNFLEKPNVENSTKMLIASNLSGEAINISRTTAPHALSYPFTSLYGIPHGHAVFITLKEFMRFNLENKEISKARFNFNDRTARLISLINCKNEKNFLDFLDELKKNSKLNFDLQSYGIKIEEDYKKILDGVNIKRLNNNPVEVNESVIKKILFNI
tara:strand:+ start:19817 stop:20923 length:1107 start_codon:yes stop_codon:yes gene_type:complete